MYMYMSMHMPIRMYACTCPYAHAYAYTYACVCIRAAISLREWLSCGIYNHLGKDAIIEGVALMWDLQSSGQGRHH